jgi:hypothetical protein
VHLESEIVSKRWCIRAVRAQSVTRWCDRGCVVAVQGLETNRGANPNWLVAHDFRRFLFRDMMLQTMSECSRVYANQQESSPIVETSWRRAGRNNARVID